MLLLTQGFAWGQQCRRAAARPAWRRPWDRVAAGRARSSGANEAGEHPSGLPPAHVYLLTCRTKPATRAVGGVRPGWPAHLGLRGALVGVPTQLLRGCQLSRKQLFIEQPCKTILKHGSRRRPEVCAGTARECPPAAPKLACAPCPAALPELPETHPPPSLQVMVSRGNIHEAIEYVKQIEQEVQQAMHIE